MKEITTHHDGHGLTESIHVVAEGEPGSGGAHHLYCFQVDLGHGYMRAVGRLQFQEGPPNEWGSTPGVLTVAVLAALIDQAVDFQNGPFPSEEGGRTLYHLQEAANWLRVRADKRAERGVLGLAQK